MPFSAIVLAMLPAVLDQTILATALPVIAGDRGRVSDVSWVVTAYVVAAAATTPAWGKLGDRCGRKLLLEISLIVFVGASALCGAAQDITQLVVLRTVQGAAAGGLLTLAMAAVGDLVSPRERGRYLLMCTPAGFERYFDRLAAEHDGIAPPPEAAGPVPETVVVGPPIGERSDLPSATRVTPPAARINVLVRSEDGDGRVAVMENVIAAGAAGPPLHHHDFDELFSVLAGELTFQLGDELLTRRAGEFAFAPRGAHHTFTNLSDAPARTLIVCTPASFERYFARLAAEHAGVEPPEWALQPTPPVTRVGPRSGGVPTSSTAQGVGPITPPASTHTPRA